MSAKVYFRGANGNEVEASVNEIPATCGDCSYCSSSEEYSHYDDLDGFVVYNETITCNASKKVIAKFRAEGGLRFDYGCEERVMGSKPDNCPLYEAQLL